MLYPKKERPALSRTLFREPTAEYRGAPFWAWNGRLCEETLLEQIDVFRKMGFGGAHMHVRTGFATPYLSRDFFHLISRCCERFAEEGMIGYLYDEDRWPSGSAGGQVTKNRTFRQRFLTFSPVSLPQGEAVGRALLARYAVTLNGRGELTASRRLAEEDTAPENAWYAYVCIDAPSLWFNGQTYLDSLNPDAVDAFIGMSYEGYRQAVGERFGKTVFSIFTDEPNFYEETPLPAALCRAEARLPWTEGLERLYGERYGEDLLARLPELFWELPDGRLSTVRYHFHDFLAERFSESFAGRCGAWCERNGLLLTGHVLAEATLGSQTAVVGEAMRSYRNFQLPGIDMLCNDRELLTAKQAQSASHQYGREGVLSELYGVTGWDFDFRGHKYQGDWQAALGVTVRVPHLAWANMEGEAKRDYPASIFEQSPWHEEYPLIENHFARLNTALTRGRPLVRVGVIHPIESYWLHCGPRAETAAAREEREASLRLVTETLLLGCIDFDLLAESLLPELYRESDAGFQAGAMSYETILVPEAETLRATTLACLSFFASRGGRVIFMGERPRAVDAVPQTVPLYDRCEQIRASAAALLGALERERDVAVCRPTGEAAGGYLYTMRQEAGGRWLFLAHAEMARAEVREKPEPLVIRVRGDWQVTLYDTLTGEIRALPSETADGWTVVNRTLYESDSLLLHLTAAADGQAAAAEKSPAGSPTESTSGELPGRVLPLPPVVPFTCSEPNVLLLDTAAYVLDGGALQDEEEILRLDNLCRLKLGLPPRGKVTAQPWALPEEEAAHTLTLRFTVESELPLSGLSLALEQAEQSVIELNGKTVPSVTAGCYVDRSIRCVPLPAIRAGQNVLTVSIPFGARRGAEWCYLLGNFHVSLRGRRKTLTAPADTVGFADLTGQGLPFYGGNIRYDCEITTALQTVTVRVSDYRGALARVSLDGVSQPVAFAPHEAVFRQVTPGRHRLYITVYGTRVNTFGGVHKIGQDAKWIGPDFWRSKGSDWCYEYKLHPVGLLSSPVVTET